MLDRLPITDAGLKHLVKLGKLYNLHLEGTKITDAGLKELRVLKSLRYLFVGGTRVTPQGVDEFQAAIPGCQIPGHGRDPKGK
jgi:hypothetical protein